MVWSWSQDIARTSPSIRPRIGHEIAIARSAGVATPGDEQGQTERTVVGPAPGDHLHGQLVRCLLLECDDALEDRPTPGPR